MVVRRFCSSRGVIRCLLAGAMVAGSFVAGEIRRETVVPRVRPAPPLVVTLLQPGPGDEDIPAAKVLRDGPFTARLKKRPTKTDPDIECQLVILEKNGRRVLTLGPDYGCEPYGSDASFEFYDLKPGARMLWVDQYQYRDSLSTVVALSPKPHIIFKSKDFNVKGAAVKDIDGDGIPELLAESMAYDYMGGIGTGRFLQLTDTIFRYDPVTGKYRPANPEFRAYLLPQIENAKQQVIEARNLQPPDQREYKTTLAVISVVIGYIMLGEEDTGWAYLEQYCPETELVRAAYRKSLEGRLAEDPAYQAIRRRRK